MIVGCYCITFAIGVLIPIIPLYLFADAKFTTVMKIGALVLYPISDILSGVCPGAAASLMSDRLKERHSRVECDAYKMPIILPSVDWTLYISQIHYFGGGWILQEADGTGVGWFESLTIATVPTAVDPSHRRNECA